MVSRRFLALAPVIAVAFVIGAGAFATLAARASSQAPPRVWVISPQEGAVLEGSTVVLHLGTENLHVTDQGIGPDTAGQGHFHTTLAGRPFIAHYTRTVVFNDLPPGEHALRVEPVINAHMQTIPGLQSLVVRFRTTGVSAGPSIQILEPQEGEVVRGGAVTLRLGWSNLGVVEPGVNAV